MTDKTFLLELRESAMTNRNPQYRTIVRDVADRLAAAITAFADFPSRATCVEVNGLWAVGERTLKNQPQDDPPLGGAVRVERERMAA